MKHVTLDRNLPPLQTGDTVLSIRGLGKYFTRNRSDIVTAVDDVNIDVAPGGRAVILSYVAVAAVLPMIGLFLVALNGYWTPMLDWSNLSLRSFRQILFNDPMTLRALTNSLTLGALA